MFKLDEYALTRQELVRRMGYSNVSKGLRRVEAIFRGDVALARQLRKELARGLRLDLAEIDRIVEAEAAAQRDRSEVLYRRDFKPHAVILTSRSIPSPIFAYAMARVDKMLRIVFEPGSSPLTFVAQARKKMPPGVVTMGRTTGFVINYAPDKAVEFDLRGRPLRTRNRAIRIGEASAAVRGRRIDMI
jgi:hypothetical protein